MSEPGNYGAAPWASGQPSGLALAPEVVIGGKYCLKRPAGFGGMGAIWVAVNEATGAEVALKVLLAEDAHSPEAAARFRREAHAAARLSHRGIVRVFDLVELAGEHAGTLVMIMELLHGETLASRFDRQRQLGVAESIGITMALLSALAHAHAAGIVHRDLKPENVFLSVDPDGHETPKILDFGISKLNVPEAPRITGDGALLGTPNYMSPEQARGAHDVDARSDLFSMGILLYEMLAGVSPFAEGSYHAVVAAILEREPAPIDGLAPALWQVIARALQKKASERYQSAEELTSALRAVIDPGGLDLREPVYGGRMGDPGAMAFAPPRRSVVTISNEYGMAKRRRRGTQIMAVAMGMCIAFGAAGFYIARTAPAKDPLLPRVSVAPLHAPQAPVAQIIPAPSPVAPPLPPPPNVAFDALPVVTSLPASPSVVPTAAAPARTLVRKPPRATSAPKDPGEPAPPSGPLVRDPGF